MKFNQLSLLPPLIIPPRTDQLKDARTFQGIPCLDKIGSRLFAAWFSGGTSESYKNYVCLAISDDDGVSWSDAVRVVQPQNFPVRTFDPQLWSHEGKLYLFFAQDSGGKDGEYDCYDGKAGVWMSELLNPQDAPDKFQFSDPVRLADGIMCNKPVALSDGTWALPCSLWSVPGFYDPDLGLEPGAYMVVSTDGGKTFSIRSRIEMRQVEGGPDFDEHAFVERKDGTIVAWMRVNKGIAESISADGGISWSSPVLRKDISGPSSRFFLQKLSSGKWLLVYNDSPERRNMTAWISLDEGRTWQFKHLLDAREAVSYPSGIENSDGNLYITYDRQRTSGGFIYLTKFSPESIISGNGDMIRQTLISSTKPIPEK